MSYIGKTRIEMRNVHTGRVEKVEHGNVFRGENIQRYLKTFGCFLNSYTGTYGNIELWKDVVGGILLFDDAVPTDSTIVPAGVGMTGNGAYGIANNTDPVEMGSWNESESSVSADGNTITMVYDWNTSQGNGTISSVCLTSYAAGYMGIGNKSGTSITNANMTLTTRRNVQRYGVAYYAGRLFKNRQMQSINISGNVATIVYKDIWALNAVLNNNTYTTELNLQVPPVSISGRYWFQLNSSKLIVIRTTRNNDIYSGDTVYIDIINMDNMQVTSKQIVNTTGLTLQVYGSGGLTIVNVSSDAILLRDLQGENHQILNIDTEVWSSFEIREYTGAIGRSGGLNSVMINSGLYMMPGTYVDKDNTNVIYMCDVVRHTYLPVNISSISQGFYDNVSGGILTKDATPISNPFYLATINNLEESVTKDVSKTMKVIYTLQRSA